MGLKWAYVVCALHKWLILICPETDKTSSFKIKYEIALDSLYMFTGNDVNTYFRSAENRIGSRFLADGTTDSVNIYSFGN